MLYTLIYRQGLTHPKRAISWRGLIQNFEFFMEASQVETFLCAEFENKIALKTWRPTGDFIK